MDKEEKFGSSASPLDSNESSNESSNQSVDEDEEKSVEEPKAPQMPYIYWRNNVKHERSQIHTYAQNDTEQDLMDVERELKRRFEDDTVYTLDVREAVLKAGLQNEETVQEIMEEWGYGIR